MWVDLCKKDLLFFFGDLPRKKVLFIFYIYSKHILNGFTSFVLSQQYRVYEYYLKNEFQSDYIESL